MIPRLWNCGRHWRLHFHLNLHAFHPHPRHHLLQQPVSTQPAHRLPIIPALILTLLRRPGRFGSVQIVVIVVEEVLVVRVVKRRDGCGRGGGSGGGGGDGRLWVGGLRHFWYGHQHGHGDGGCMGWDGLGCCVGVEGGIGEGGREDGGVYGTTLTGRREEQTSNTKPTSFCNKKSSLVSHHKYKKLEWKGHEQRKKIYIYI